MSHRFAARGIAVACVAAVACYAALHERGAETGARNASQQKPRPVLAKQTGDPQRSLEEIKARTVERDAAHQEHMKVSEELSKAVDQAVRDLETSRAEEAAARTD